MIGGFANGDGDTVQRSDAAVQWISDGSRCIKLVSKLSQLGVVTKRDPRHCHDAVYGVDCVLEDVVHCRPPNAPGYHLLVVHATSKHSECHTESDGRFNSTAT